MTLGISPSIFLFQHTHLKSSEIMVHTSPGLKGKSLRGTDETLNSAKQIQSVNKSLKL